MGQATSWFPLCLTWVQLMNDPDMNLIGLYVEKNDQHVRMRKLLPNTISQKHFHKCLRLYDDFVRDVYHRVEAVRFKKIPKSWEERNPPSLTRDEVIDLDRWIQYVRALA